MMDVPGQGRVTAVLSRAAERGEVGHAWAFLGPPGVGQEAIARELAAALNCTSGPAAGVACASCDVCRRCRRGAFAAYSEFAPTGAMHRVEAVRSEWLHTASRTPAEGSWKILRIVEADRMNEAACNAFLKSLEEPPPRTTWILEIADPDELPDTILSRCRVLRLQPPGIDRLEEDARRLGLTDAADAALAARAAMAAPRALARLAAPGGLDALRSHRGIPRRLREERQAAPLLLARELDDEVKRRVEELKGERESELADLADAYQDEVPPPIAKQVEERHKRRERELRVTTLQGAIDDLVGWYRDCLVAVAGGDADTLVHRDAFDEACADAGALGPARLLECVDRCLATREDLEFNVQYGLAMEALFMDLLAITLRP